MSEKQEQILNEVTFDSTQTSENKLFIERLGKLDKLRLKENCVYPNDFFPNAKAAQLHDSYLNFSKEDLVNEKIEVAVAGRMMLKRIMGKASFATIYDDSTQIQLYLNPIDIGQEVYTDFKHWDIGDIVGATGILFRTNTGELSIHCQKVRLLVKSLRPLPDKFCGLEDREVKYRQRYLDLLSNTKTRATFTARSKIIASIRNYMNSASFVEVETPMLHPISGGAAALPFVTHHNALNMQMYLRIAPELYLKRLLVGGMERVFEINRNFRNEGISIRHNPEFTMLEFYAAYTDYNWLMQFTETLLHTLAVTYCGSHKFHYEERLLDFSLPFARLSLIEAIIKYAPEYQSTDLTDLFDAKFLQIELQKHGVNVINDINTADQSLGSLQLALFETCAEHLLWQPTYIVNYPAEVSPLARCFDTRSNVAERFELFIAGRELSNGYSELNDPQAQKDCFLRQIAQKDAGNKEAMSFDADYIRALEYGMPPAGGCGIGIDRLVMLLTDNPNIRDVILFPSLRAESC